MKYYGEIYHFQQPHTSTPNSPHFYLINLYRTETAFDGQFLFLVILCFSRS